MAKVCIWFKCDYQHPFIKKQQQQQQQIKPKKQTSKFELKYLKQVFKG